MRPEATRPIDDETVGPDPTAEPAADPLALLAAPGPARSDLPASLAALRPEEVRAFLQRLNHHRVDGLAWRRIATLPSDVADPWLRAALRRRHQQRAAATLVQGLALAEVLEALARSGVAAAVMRGLRTVEWIYKDAGARPFEDHDLLIAPHDAAAAAGLLVRLGYGEVSAGLFRRASVSIDLHTDPLGARRRPTRARLFPLDTVALLSAAREGRVAGAPALLLAGEDDVVLLALHVVKHSFDRLIRLADLAHLVAAHGGAIDWSGVRERAERARALRLVALAFGAAECLGVRAPAALRPEEPAGGLTALLLRRVRALRPLPYAGEVLMALEAPGLKERVRFLWDALLPGGETPAGGWTARGLGRRTAAILDGAARRVAARREAR